MEINSRDQGLSVEKAMQHKKCKLNLKMPPEYISQNHEEIQQIRFLLHNRGFFYTNTAVIHESARQIKK
jgi:hypothetical protein